MEAKMTDDNRPEDQKIADLINTARAAARDGKPLDSSWPSYAVDAYLAEKAAQGQGGT